MKKIMAGVFVFGLLCFGLVAFAANALYKMGVQEGIKLGRGTVPAPSQYEMDKACIAWLMESNIKEAKLRICGKR